MQVSTSVNAQNKMGTCSQNVKFHKLSCIQVTEIWISEVFVAWVNSCKHNKT